MEIYSDEIKPKDIEILSNREYDKLEPILHEINRNFVRIEEEDRRKNVECFNRCVDYMIIKMKESNQTFRDLFQRINYTGSFYEGSRVQEPNEFDINLILRKPFNFSVLEDNYTPGYVKLQVNQSIPETSQNRDQRRWVQNGLISAQAVRCWMEGVISTVFHKAGASGTSITVNGMYSITVLTKSGPAITLRMQNIYANRRAEKIDVDFVPVFEFQYPNWPQRTRSIPSYCTSPEWYVTPKFDNGPLNWRLSFASIEREMIHDKPNLKNIYRILKRLRDCCVNLKNIKSYHIKSLFLWEVDQLNSTEWRKSMGRIFMMMLFELENSLGRGEIPFFWDRRMNMIGHLNPALRRDMYGRILNIRKKICRYLREDMDKLPSYMCSLFTQGSTDDVIVNGIRNLNLNQNVNEIMVEPEAVPVQSSSWSCVLS